MQTGFVVVLVGLLIVTVCDPSAGEEDRTSNIPLIISAGGTVYEGTEGKPVTITTPGGEKVEIIVRLKKTREYKRNGISFSYPHDLTLSEDRKGKVLTVTLESVRSPTASIQVHPAQTNPDQVRKILVDEFEKRFRADGHQISEKDKKKVSRLFRDGRRDGIGFDVSFAGHTYRMEFYAFKKPCRVIAALFMHAPDDEDIAQRYFSTVAESLDCADR